MQSAKQEVERFLIGSRIVVNSGLLG